MANGRIETDGRHYRIYFGFGPNFESIKEAVKLLPSRRFHGKDDTPDGVPYWSVPRNDSTILPVARLAALYGLEFLDESAHAVDPHAIKQEADLAFQKAIVASKAFSSNPFHILGLNPKLTPRPYQYAGVAYALDAVKQGYGVLIADDVGLGKTIEAIMLIAARQAYPTLVLTLASVKIGFKRELEKWLPGKHILLLEGRKALPLDAYRTADVIVANYDIIATVNSEPVWVNGKKKDHDTAVPGTHLEALLGLKLAGFVLDECHRIKDYKTKTSKAATLLVKRVGRGLKIALTGTPILNRSKELLSTVMILDQLDHLGGFWVFAKRYCGWVEGEGMGAAPVSEATRLELHDLMRGQGMYLRRLRKDVLADLPATSDPVIVELELSNRPAYKKAVNASLDELGKKGYDRAEALVRLSLLRGLAAEGKIKGVVEWINSFLEAGEKFVVFADHIVVQNALRQEFPNSAYIAGEQSALKRQLQIDRFVNDPNIMLMVASLKAGGTGVDQLQTVAHHVGFVELGWNPGIMDQAQGRLERSGQTKSVVPYYFIAPETIDGDMLELLDVKRQLVAAILDGETEAQLLARKALLTRLGQDENGQPNLDIVKELTQRLWQKSGRAEVESA